MISEYVPMNVCKDFQAAEISKRTSNPSIKGIVVTRHPCQFSRIINLTHSGRARPNITKFVHMFKHSDLMHRVFCQNLATKLSLKYTLLLRFVIVVK